MRLKSLTFNLANKRRSIRFISDGGTSLGNHFSILIGENGVGKSSTLKEVSEILRPFSRKDKASLVLEGNVQRMLAFSVGVNDKFPLPSETFKSKLEKIKSRLDHISFEQSNYIYLGIKTGKDTYNTSKIAERLLESIAFYWNSNTSDRLVSSIFKECGFKNELILKFRFTDEEFGKKFSKGNVKMPEFLSSLRLQGRGTRLVGRFDQLLKENEQFLKLVLDKLNSRNIHKGDASGGITRFIKFGHGTADKFFQHELLMLILLRELDILTFEDIQVMKPGGKNTPFSLLEAGSGELNRFLLLFKIAALTVDNTLILIDEPEISMHPQWQVDLIEKIRKLLKRFKGCHVIVATHAPYIISSLTNTDSSIISMSKSRIKTWTGATFGWSVEKILLDVFDLATVRNHYFEIKIKKILVLLEQDINRKKKRNKEEALGLIKEIEGFVVDKNDPLGHVIAEVRNTYA